MARRGGVKRLSGDVYEYVRDIMHVFLSEILYFASVEAEHGRRKRISPMDITLALKRVGRAIFKDESLRGRNPDRETKKFLDAQRAAAK